MSRAKDGAQPLHVRLLTPSHGGELAPIVSPALDERIYHLVALTLRAYVLSWLPRITRDKALVPALAPLLVAVLEPILRALPGALPQLVLYDLPTILAVHVRTYRLAGEGWGGVVGGGDEDDDADGGGQPGPSNSAHGSSRRAKAYHALLPLRCVRPVPPVPLQTSAAAAETGASATPSPDSATPIPATAPATTSSPPAALADSAPPYALDPAYLSSLSSAILHATLPPAEKASAAQMTMATEVVGRAVLGGVGRRVSQPWFWHQLLLRLLGAPRVAASTANARVGAGDKNKVDTQYAATDTRRDRPTRSYADVPGLLVRAVVRLWQAMLLAWSALAWALAMPPATHVGCAEPAVGAVKAIVGAPTWPARAVWGLVDLIVVVAGPALDRVIPALLDRRLTERAALSTVDLVERVLYPTGYPAPSPPDPTPAEAWQLRADAVRRLDELVPAWMQRTFFPPVHHAGTRRQDATGGAAAGAAIAHQSRAACLIDWLDDAECNAHLIGMVLDAVVAAVLPELVEGAASSSMDV